MQPYAAMQQLTLRYSVPWNNYNYTHLYCMYARSLLFRGHITTTVRHRHRRRALFHQVLQIGKEMVDADADADAAPSAAEMAVLAEEVDVDGADLVGRRKRGGKSSGARRGGAGAQGQGREVLISKALSKLLRHAALDEGLELDAEGFARLDSVLQWPRLKSLNVTFEDIRTAVNDNAKQRFSMKPNPSLATPPSPASENPADWVIRANQGHSIAVDSAALLVPITLEADNIPETVVHGTYFAFYDAIVQSGGLKKMGRNHVHFGTGLPEEKGGVVSGMRGDAELLVYVDVKRCLEEEPEMKWWMSENGVVLTEGDGNGVVGTRVWKKVVGRREGGLLWEDGVKVGELEESLRRRRAPQGKGRGGGAGDGRAARGGRGSGRNGRGGRGAARGGKRNDGVATETAAPSDEA
ncbi:tRNA 2'-phosphotransferase [Clarireedia jacksonii]